MDGTLLGDLHGSGRGTLTNVMRFVTDLGGTLVLDVVFVVAVIALLLGRRRRDALLLALASPGSVALVQLLKAWVDRVRPPGDHLVAAGGPSWPSGHAGSSLALYGALILIAGRRSRIATAAVIVLIAAIGVSRVYLGVHYPSDVIASWLLVGGWLALLARTFRRSAR